jgi:hypothetical protein
MIAVLILGGVFLVLGGIGLAYRSQLDDVNMRMTPRWLKPTDGGGVYAPSQKPFRVKGMAIAMTIMIVLGIGLVLVAILTG